MEKKQTAVEWLFEQINDALIQFSEGKISAAVYGIKATEFKYKAKEMEKEQMRIIYDGLLKNVGTYIIQSDLLNFEQYYNKTYGTKNN